MKQCTVMPNKILNDLKQYMDLNADEEKAFTEIIV